MFEVYENNAGNLFLAVIQDGECVAIFDGWEYGKVGELAKVFNSMAFGGDDWADWDSQYTNGAAAVLYNGFYAGDLIASCTHGHGTRIWLSDDMGIAGRRAFGVGY